ncbi:GNAT family N-acetyltransferase [Novosphingobium sp. G106]|uniref:GNAT family N-acetyltransferase n=1 Tax=Novosphingobium sp. G106 TaxID=2849500 RepID=UPI0020C4C32A|nr:GNAT family N-acetyltransferase [Novosphingobium sp. G106]
MVSFALLAKPFLITSRTGAALPSGLSSFLRDASYSTRGTGRMLGYLIAYPWTARSAPPLNSLVQALPNDAEVLYLHDLALLREAQGKNLTRIIIDRLADQARRDGWRAIALVAVNDATAFWAKAGFAEADEPAMREKLASYGAGATYMTRTLGA